MKKVELVHLPYYIFRATVSQGDAEHEITACVDGIACGFSFFNSNGVAFRDEASGEVFDFRISAEEAERACRDGLRWHLVRQGLRLKVKPSVKAIHSVEGIYYPYWIAYFRRRGSYEFRAADAVTGEIQGVRMRNAFLTAFSQGEVSSSD
jgi:hypothetical protein